VFTQPDDASTVAGSFAMTIRRTVWMTVTETVIRRSPRSSAHGCRTGRQRPVRITVDRRYRIVRHGDAPNGRLVGMVDLTVIVV
jgi:hypothetical protein